MSADSRKRGRPSLAEVLGILDEEVQLLHTSLGGLPRAVEADQILREIWIDDVHNSTAIEGNTMTRAQVEELVEKRRTTSSLLVETLEVEGYARAADWVYRVARDHAGVPTPVLSEIHRQVVELAWQVEPPVTRDRPGDWRKTGVSLRGVAPALPTSIAADLAEWSKSTTKVEGHPLIHAATHHAWFERIHPFADGNGRTGRLVLNFMLIQNGYPPAVILATKRPQYLQALRTADNGNPNPLAEVIARAVSGALSRFLIPKLAGEAKLVPLSALASQTGYNPAYLRYLAQTKRLRAVREGRLWLSSRSFLDDYVAQRDPRGGPPRSRLAS